MFLYLMGTDFSSIVVTKPATLRAARAPHLLWQAPLAPPPPPSPTTTLFSRKQRCHYRSRRPKPVLLQLHQPSLRTVVSTTGSCHSSVLEQMRKRKDAISLLSPQLPLLSPLPPLPQLRSNTSPLSLL